MLLVDGHNLIGRGSGLSLEREEEGREQVLRRIAAARGSGGEAVLVVFDGRGAAASEGRFGGIRVVFAPAARTADEEILRRLARGHARGATVVTSDRRLGDRARQLGARVEPSETFWKRLLERSSRPRNAEPAKPEPKEEDVEDWIALFQEGAAEEKHKI